MSLFLQLLTQWNGGIRRGSQIKLAKELGISHTKISDWVANRQKPGEENIKKMAQLFGVPEKDLKEIFAIKDKNAAAVQTWSAYPIKAYVPLLGEVKANRFNCIEIGRAHV